MSHGFTKIREAEIAEMATKAVIYRHDKTGARVLSMINDDENKVFGISFRTPPRGLHGRGPHSGALPCFADRTSILSGSLSWSCSRDRSRPF